MIGLLVGSVFQAKQNPMILMVGGVGYSVSVPQGLLSKIKPADKLTLYTQTYAREDTLELFGFARPEELRLFELLQTVPGIGPRTALLVIDRGVDAIKNAVSQSDVEFFMAVPRLGRKNSQKIIIELKSKLGSTADLDLTQEESSDTKQIIAALSSMGFDRRETREAVKRLPSEGSLEQKIKLVLRSMGK